MSGHRGGKGLWVALGRRSGVMLEKPAASQTFGRKQRVSHTIEQSLQRIGQHLPVQHTSALWHLPDDGRGKLGAFHFLRPLDLPRQVVGHPAGLDSRLYGIANGGTRLFPSHVIKHHGAG